MNTTNGLECDLQWNIDHLKPFIVLHQRHEMLFNRISIFIKLSCIVNISKLKSKRNSTFIQLVMLQL